MRDPSLVALRPGTVFQGRYHVLRCIKAGGMGAVHEVLDAKTDARRALKVMLPGLLDSPGMRARFALEARVSGAVQSEHIVHVTDAGVDEETGTPFLVMELLRGEELGGMLARRKRLPPGEVVVYLFQAALALDKTHAAGIVHRDLKPENLFVTTRDDGSPCLKILDFGIAKVVAESSQDHASRAVGTPLYMAPEQVQGDTPLGPRVDVYALGHIAYALLVGQPYWSEEFNEGALLPFFSKLARGLEESASRRAARRGTSLSTAFDAWFCRATAARQEDRFARASEAVAVLAKALGVRIPRPSLPEFGLADTVADVLAPTPTPTPTSGSAVALGAPASTASIPEELAAGAAARRALPGGRAGALQQAPVRSGTTSGAVTASALPRPDSVLISPILIGALAGAIAVALFALGYRSIKEEPTSTAASVQAVSPPGAALVPPAATIAAPPTAPSPPHNSAHPAAAPQSQTPTSLSAAPASSTPPTPSIRSNRPAPASTPRPPAHQPPAPGPAASGREPFF